MTAVPCVGPDWIVVVGHVSPAQTSFAHTSIRLWVSSRPSAVSFRATTGPPTTTIIELYPTSAPPAPVLPRSLIQAVTNAAPWNPVVGARVVPLRAALIAVSVPVNVIDSSAVPSPAENVNPLTLPRVRVP